MSARYSHRPLTPFELGRPARTALLNYRAGWDLWWLSVPCEECGGAEMPLDAQIPLDRRSETIERIVHEINMLGCPCCHALDRRSTRRDDPEVWYEPLLRDWVVRVPDPCGQGAILPLEIPWFDAPMSVVFQSAADLVYADESFCGDDEPDEDASVQ